jgi:aspartate-semialdehyde dehydrogenase
MKELLNVGVFGATGEVGQEMINVLRNTGFPAKDVNFYAGKSAGKPLDSPFGTKIVQNSDDADYSSLDLALWAVGADWSRENWKKAEGTGCFVIDNSSAFRYEEEIPLVIPEINGFKLKNTPSRLIANPNCTTAIAAIPLHLLNQVYGIEKIIFTTYQAASGAGNGGRKELLEQSRNYLDGKYVGHNIFAHPLPFNIIPHIDRFMDNGYTKEEMKTDWETRKILWLGPEVKISSTCVRVPVERSHALDVLVETREPVDYESFKTSLAMHPMVALTDDPTEKEYPMPIITSGTYEVHVGRIRQPEVFNNGIRMFVCGDQLLRGAALNAVLIAKKLYDYGRFG